jgi:hypothetical protein
MRKEWRKEPVYVEMTGRKLRGKIIDAKIFVTVQTTGIAR